jgi:hypothetical protein
MAGAQSLQRAHETRPRLHGPTLEIDQNKIDLQLISGNTGSGTPSAQQTLIYNNMKDQRI